MKKIKKLELSPRQLLSLEEQRHTVAGIERRLLYSYGSCTCKAVGNTHTITDVFEVSTDYVGVVGGAVAIIGGIATSSVYLGVPCVGYGVYQMVTSFEHEETVMNTYECTSVNKYHRPTSHKLIKTSY